LFDKGLWTNLESRHILVLIKNVNVVIRRNSVHLARHFFVIRLLLVYLDRKRTF
jgi:hypothetical protein